MIDKKVVYTIISTNKRIDQVKVANEELNKRVESLEDRYQRTLQKPELEKEPEQRTTLVSLTTTESQILQILLTEGGKTAPEIEKKIGKTREHTSRLMKKLWQEGYVERDTHTIPFTYRPTKELKIKAQTQTA